MARKVRHLLLATLEDPFNPRSWSGTPYNIRVALENKIEKLSVLGNLKPKRTPVNAALRVLLGGKPPRYPLYLTHAAQQEFARQTLQAIDQLKPDALLTISSHCVIGMGTPPVPAFMVTDAPWLSWKETYRDFERMPLLGPRFARREAEASERYTGLIFSSDWAVEEARRLYGAPKEKLHSIPLGANWTPGIGSAELETIVRARPENQVQLLFVGKDWERKGGPLAIQIAQELKAATGWQVRLHIVGCTPTVPEAAREIVQVHGFLSSTDPGQAQILKSLYLHSHFLVVPTRSECFGVVFAEAQAFGLPPVSRSVHAVPSIILDGKTGIVEPPDAPASAYVERIAALTRDRPRYLDMAAAARSHFEARLTWESFASGVVDTISDAL